MDGDKWDAAARWDDRDGWMGINVLLQLGGVIEMDGWG